MDMSDTGRWWLSSKAMTIEVEIEADLNHYDENIITKTPPIARKFIGQPFGQLISWMMDQGDFRMEEMK